MTGADPGGIWCFWCGGLETVVNHHRNHPNCGTCALLQMTKAHIKPDGTFVTAVDVVLPQRYGRPVHVVEGVDVWTVTTSKPPPEGPWCDCQEGGMPHRTSAHAPRPS